MSDLRTIAFKSWWLLSQTEYKRDQQIPVAALGLYCCTQYILKVLAGLRIKYLKFPLTD